MVSSVLILSDLDEWMGEDMVFLDEGLVVG